MPHTSVVIPLIGSAPCGDSNGGIVYTDTGGWTNSPSTNANTYVCDGSFVNHTHTFLPHSRWMLTVGSLIKLLSAESRYKHFWPIKGARHRTAILLGLYAHESCTQFQFSLTLTRFPVFRQYCTVRPGWGIFDRRIFWLANEEER